VGRGTGGERDQDQLAIRGDGSNCSIFRMLVKE